MPREARFGGAPARAASAVARVVPPALLSRAVLLHARSSLLRRATRALGLRTRGAPAEMTRGRAVGLRLSSTGGAAAYLYGAHEQAVQDALAGALDAGAVLYDIGANIGFFSLVAARIVGDSGLVYAFDPVPANAAGIGENTRLNGFANVEVIQAGVSASSGSGSLYVPPDASAFARLGEPSAVVPSGVERLEVRTVAIDEFVAAGARPPTVVKIDVEGGELDVVKGMGATLREHRPVVICEVHGRARQFRETISGFGYRPSLIDGDGDVDGAAFVGHYVATAG
jgi:FkbM family methyltransferase